MGRSRTFADGMLVDKLQGKFVELCWAWIAKNQSTKTDLGKVVGLPVPRITELMKSSRKLTMYYVRLFHRRGIFKVDDIYDGKAQTLEEKETWEIMKMTEDTELLKYLSRALNGTLKREALIQILQSHTTNGNQ